MEPAPRTASVNRDGGGGGGRSSPRGSGKKESEPVEGLYRIRRYDPHSTHGAAAVQDQLRGAALLALDGSASNAAEPPNGGNSGTSSFGGLLNPHHQLNVVRGKPTRFANRGPEYARYIRDGHAHAAGNQPWTFSLRSGDDPPRPTEEYLRDAEARLGRSFSGNARDFGSFAALADALSDGGDFDRSNNHNGSRGSGGTMGSPTAIWGGSSWVTESSLAAAAAFLSPSPASKPRLSSSSSFDSRPPAFATPAQQPSPMLPHHAAETSVFAQQLLPPHDHKHRLQFEEPNHRLNGHQQPPQQQNYHQPSYQQGGAPMSSQALHALRSQADSYGNVDFPTPPRRSAPLPTHSPSHQGGDDGGGGSPRRGFSPQRHRYMDAMESGFRVI